jgi:site-specific DNA recombinase
LSKYHKDKADAIERQRLDLTRKLATEGGWTVMGEYIDNDSASASAAKTRKGWQQLNADILSGNVQAVAFWKLDRTNRIAAKCIEWIGECQRSGVYLVSHQDSAEELNTATASAKLMTGLKALLAEVETDSMSERQLAAKRHLAEAGFHHGGQVPLGWMAGPRVIDEFGRSGVRLIPHPVEHVALKEAVELVLAGKSLRQIARHWRDQHGITTAAGKLVYEATIYRALISPRMIGYRMRRVPEHERGVKIELLDYIARDAEGKPVISQEPVCDRKTWLRVRRLLEEAKTSQSRQPWGSYEWLLSGLIYCPCGERMYGHQKSRVSRHGVRSREFVYRCTANRRHGAGTCTASCAVAARQAEAFVLGWFFAQISDDALAAARARRRTASTDAALRDLLMQLDDATAERDALLSKQGTAPYRGSMVTVLLALVADAQARVDGLRRRVDAIELDERAIANGPDLIASWEQLTIMEKRAYLRRMIRRVDATPGRAPVEQRLTIIPVE